MTHDRRGEEHLQERESYLEARVEVLQREIDRLKAGKLMAAVLYAQMGGHISANTPDGKQVLDEIRSAVEIPQEVNG